MAGHALVLNDRNVAGERHRHRWHPSCECGRWHGINAETVDKAAEQYRAHRRKEAREDRIRLRRRHRDRLPQPQAVTPAHLLPEALR